MTRRLTACALIAGAALAATPTLATTPISGTLHVQAQAGLLDLQTFQSDAHLASSGDSWSGVPAALQAQAATSASLNGGVVIAPFPGLTAFAGWSGADQGTVQLHGYGWFYDTPTGMQLFASYEDPQTPDWSYTFTATRNGLFDMQYAVGGGGSSLDALTGLNGWRINWSGAGGDQFLPLGSVSHFERPLVAGQTYTVSLSNFARVDAQGAFDNVFAHQNGDFFWQISGSAAPEPAVWALILVGSGIAGASLRRRRALA